MNLICGCKQVIRDVDLWFLKDIENFSKRKIIFANCPVCGEPVVTLIETRTSDNQQFVNKNITGMKAIRIIYNEKTRILAKRQNINASDVFGWVYGVNVGITNKKGDITQTRMYASSFDGNKRRLVDTIYFSK
ncbi:MAG: hypothetical protein E7Z87_08240 [Cyanobacteria bacterium SIG26]|nr:hypothetical protein [Cyanobacteria bacterium SIG26]